MSELQQRWEKTVNERNVLLFCFLFPDEDQFIRTHCSTAGGIQIDEVLRNIYEIDDVNPIVIFRDGHLHYHIADNYQAEMKELIQATFGKATEEVKEDLKRYLGDDSEEINQHMVNNMHAFFQILFGTPFKGGERVEENLEHYVFTNSKWRVVLLFGGYSYNQPYDSFIPLQIFKIIVDKGYTKDTDIRLFILPFASDDLLRKFTSNTSDRIVHVLDAVSMLYIQRAIELGGDNNGARLSEAQIKRMPELTQGVTTGLLNWLRRWQHVLALGKNQ